MSEDSQICNTSTGPASRIPEPTWAEASLEEWLGIAFSVALSFSQSGPAASSCFKEV